MVVLVLMTYIGLFIFENIPTSLVVGGILAQLAHLALLSSFPFFSVSSPSFIVAVIMVLVNHYFAFSYFGENYYPFSEVMAYFTICMWLVSFCLSSCLFQLMKCAATINERRPLMSEDNDVVSNYFSKKQKGYGLLSVFNSVKDTVTPSKTQFKSY
eukprot:TRINITY_DN18690_c0_g1_i1.p1 TRINITY_DN18690_c0_g1~~TRINITY_DN18690_c0_g1_i1.p1  ORF type:complete len:178 (-),score=23.71 TRINITY_DN18690_c0_g1_i1:393-860(-)